MDLPVSLFSTAWHGLALALTLPLFVWLGRTTPWRRLMLPSQSHLMLGFAVALALLWSLKTGVKPGLNLHLLGAMAAALALGPQLAVVTLGLALTGITLNGALEWQSWPLNFVLMAVVPVLAASALQRLVERRLPTNFFTTPFVVYRPEWGAAFDDRRYLANK